MYFNPNIVQCAGVIADESGSTASSVSFDLQQFRENLQVEEVMKDGVISNWDNFEKLWEHATSETYVVKRDECPVLFAEKPFNPPASRHR
jgi:actin-related protein